MSKGRDKSMVELEGEARSEAGFGAVEMVVVVFLSGVTAPSATRSGAIGVTGRMRFVGSRLIRVDEGYEGGSCAAVRGLSLRQRSRGGRC
jgi:hypothetical protein